MIKKTKLSKELVRIHAHLCGDGGLYVYKTAEKDRINRADICYFNTNQQLITSFRKDMKKLFGVKMYYDPNNYVVRVKSLRIAKKLLELSKYHTRTWKIPQIIKKSSRKLKIEWIKAFSYDEGYLPRDRNIIRIKSMNLNGLKDLKKVLDSIQIPAKLSGPNCDDSYYINIKKIAELKKFTKRKSRK